jgi:hypothetical protein
VTRHDDTDTEHDVSQDEVEYDEEQEPEPLPESDANNIRRSCGSMLFSTKVMGMAILRDHSANSLFNTCADEKSSSTKMRSAFEGRVD